MAKDLRSYLRTIEEANEVAHIDREVDPGQNLGGLAWQGENRLGKATLFHNLKGYPGWRAVSYAEASRKRMALALGVTPREFIPKLRELLMTGPTPKVSVPTGPVKDVIQTGDKVNLYDLPIHTMAVLDASPYMGGHMAIIRDPETGIQNVSLHRHQLRGKDKLGVMMHPGRHMHMIYQKYEARKEPMPIALVGGHHALYYLASTWTFPFGVDEFEWAGTFLGEPVRTVKGETVDIDLPADAETVIEGFVPPFEREMEGPFTEHTGYARAGSGKNPFMHVSAITRRQDAIYYALQGGRPIASSQILDALPMEVVLWNRIKDVGGYVDLKDIVVVPCAGGAHVVVIQLTPQIQGQVTDVLMAALSSPYIHPKIAIAVDDDIDPHDVKELMWSLSTRVNPAEDIFIVPGTRGQHLDASLKLVTPPGTFPDIRVGSKMGIDATKPAITEPDRRAYFERSFGKGMEFNIEDFLRR
ncbi:MAG TPA: UbiD family decarboxylase [Bacillota bacterium]|jgi:UbiD family decarboxylase